MERNERNRRGKNPLAMMASHGGGMSERASELIEAAEERYSATNPRPDARPEDRAGMAWYRGLLTAIGEAAGSLQIKDLDTLDYLFTRVYIPFSLSHGSIPKIIDFCLFAGIDYYSLYNYINNNPNSSISNLYNKWFTVTRELTISSVQDSNNSQVNNIFILKAVYGLSDQPGQAATPTKRPAARSREEVIAELKGYSVEENTQNDS